MAIETHCPTCLKTYTVADEQAGKTVRCKHCADMFTVSGTPVASRARDRDEDRDDRRSPYGRSRSPRRAPRPLPRSSGGDFPWVAVCILGGVAVLCIMIGAGFVMYTVSQSNPQANNNPPPLFFPNNPFADPVDITDALTFLADGDVFRRKRGAEWLSKQRVDPRRQVEVAQALEQRLDDPDHWAKQAIQGAFCRWAERRDADTLIRIAGNGDDEVWKKSLDALVRLKDARAGELLAAALPNHGRRGYAVTKLQELGPAAQKDVVKFLNHSDNGVRGEVKNLLARCKTPSDMLAAQNAADLQSDNNETKWQAAANLADNTVVPQLQDQVVKGLEQLVFGHDYRRDRAVAALIQWANKEAVPSLLQLLEAPNTPQKEKIINLMKEWQDERAIPALASLLASRKPGERKEAAGALKVFGPKAEPAILAVLQTQPLANRALRTNGCELLGEIGTPAAIPVLEQMAQKDRLMGEQVQKAITSIKARMAKE